MNDTSLSRNPRLFPAPGDCLEGLNTQRRPQVRHVTRVSSLSHTVVYRVGDRKEASTCTLTSWRKWAATAAVLPA